MGDNCNEFSVRVLPPGNYQDTLTIVDSPELSFSDMLCREDTVGTVSRIVANFAAFDVCGNITIEEAQFTIIDTFPPSLSRCPEDRIVTVAPADCGADISLNLPEISDNCASEDNVGWRITLDGVIISTDINIPSSLNLDLGTHLLVYEARDCGNNSAECIQSIEVIDQNPPLLTCPDDVTLYLNDDSCDLEVSLPALLDYQDNCPGTVDFQRTLPNEEGLLLFNFNSIENIHQSFDKMFDFEDVSFEGLVYSPQLFVEYKLNLDNQSTIDILSEDGTSLWTLGPEMCEDASLIINLNEDDFETWAQDAQVVFTMANNSNGGQGTTPCEPDAITDIQGEDGVSYLRITLLYSDITPESSLTDLSTGSTLPIPEDGMSLSQGSYQLEYTAGDIVDNTSNCSTLVTLTDTIAPVVNCEEVTLQIELTDLTDFALSADDLIFEASDNCDYEVSSISPPLLDCPEEL